LVIYILVDLTTKSRGSYTSLFRTFEPEIFYTLKTCIFVKDKNVLNVRNNYNLVTCFTVCWPGPTQNTYGQYRLLGI